MTRLVMVRAVQRHDERLTILEQNRHSSQNARRLDAAIWLTFTTRSGATKALARSSTPSQKNIPEPLISLNTPTTWPRLAWMRSYEEAKPFLRARIPEAASELGTEHATVLTLRCNYASALFTEGRSRDNVVEAVALRPRRRGGSLGRPILLR